MGGGSAGTGGQRVLVTPRSLTGALASGGAAAVPELDGLLEEGYELVTCTPGATPSVDELERLVPGCVGWLAGVEPIPARVLAAATSLRAISRNGTGTDAVDLDAAAARGVQVLRAAGANAQGVAELALALSLSALRHVPWSSRALRAGSWERWRGRELADTTVGVVGLGAVGQRVAAALTALGAEVLGHDPFADPGPVARAPLDALVSRAHLVTLHAPPPADGAPLVDRELLSLFREGAVLVNTARAALVDDAAVLEALDDGRLAAYAVDAFDTEPPEPSALLRHERVLATPHLGGFTGGSVSRATRQAVDNLLEALAGTGARPAGREGRGG